MDTLKPFDSSAKADIILRSSDSMDFFVIKLLLCHTSPVFDEMFSSEHVMDSKDETRNGLPIIPVAEDSRTLYCLLILVYPSYFTPGDQVVYIDDLCKVAKMVQKYCMDRIESELKKRAISCRLLEEHPFQVYVSAIQLGWTDIAVTAAAKTLTTPLRDLPFNNELHSISGADFYQYLSYRFRHEKYGGEGERPQLEFDTPSVDVKSAAKTPGTNALPPFGPTAKADAILRSSDRVDFFVKKSFLAFLSPALDAIFSHEEGISSKSDSEDNNSPIFDLEEDSDTLFALLCFLHPYADEPRIEELRTYPKIWAAAQKYKVSFIAQRLERLLLASPSVQDEPLRAFAVAVSLGSMKVIEATAKETLTKPLNDMTYVDEFRLITGAHMFRLMKYRFKCTDAVRHILGDTSVLRKAAYAICIDCNELTKNIQPPSTGGFTRYIKAIRHKLEECPRGSTLMLMNDYVLIRCARRLEDSTEMHNINEFMLCLLLKFRRILAIVIEKEIAKISVNMLRLLILPAITSTGP
ncbi:hypothetical protein APHAL10511_005244 [Amanita phalloides]|nr:hypothetical protein APHAL10511_005244 [Amanita phalloides]